MRKRLRQQARPKPWSWKDRVILGAIAIALPVGTLAIMHVTAIQQFNHSLDRNLEEMRIEYSLGETQVAEIREIEVAFHANGSPFFRLNDTVQDQNAHEIAISKKMSPKNAARFLADQKNPAHRERLRSIP